MSRIAVIGAGIAGLTIARELDRDHDVTVIDKGRGVGGRVATRYIDDYRFDHGAQFFTARSRRFRDYLQPFIDAGVVATWHARFAEMTRSNMTASRRWDDDYPHYVGSPGMNAWPKAMAEGLQLTSGCRVTSTDFDGSRWTLQFDNGDAQSFDWLIVTAPAPQASELLGSAFLELGLGNKEPMRACYAVMLGFPAPLETPFDASRVLDADISWISVNASKPGRNDRFTMVVHATNAWADANTEMPIEDAQRHLLSEFRDVSGIDPEVAEVVQTHRWRYANTIRQTGEPFALDPSRQLGVCGDWMIRGRVEAAFSSAMQLEQAMRERLD